MNPVEDSTLPVDSARVARGMGELHERGPLRQLGLIPRLGITLVVVMVMPQIAAQIAQAAGPWLKSVDPDNAFAWLSVHHLSQIAMTLALMLLWGGWSLKQWGFNLNEANVSLRWLGWFALFFTLGTLVFAILPMILTHSAHPLFPLGPFPLNARNVSGSLGFYYLLSGSGEEPLFRGFVLSMLLVAWRGELRVGRIVLPTAALWVTLLFMLAHINYTISPFRITQFVWQQQLMALAVGLFYALAMYRTGSLLCPILAHGFSNGIVWSLIYLAMAFAPVQPTSPEILGRAGVEPNPPVAGQEATVLYRAAGGPLEAVRQLSLHYGINGWNQPADQPMVAAGEQQWLLKFRVPPGTLELDFAFTDGTRWDNSGGQDWRLPVRLFSASKQGELIVQEGSQVLSRPR